MCENKKVESEILKMKSNLKTIIHQNINKLTIDQLDLIFHIYLQLNSLCNFYISEKSHINFINLFLETPSNRNPLTFKSLITLLTTQFTPEENYPLVLETIDMIKKNIPFESLLTTLYLNHQP